MSPQKTSLKRAVIYCLFILLGLVSSLPSLLPSNFLNQLPPWYSTSQFQLGLDLRGGSQLTMAVDTESLIAHQLQRLLDQVEDAAKESKIKIKNTAITDSILSIELNSYQDRQVVRAKIDSINRDLANAYQVLANNINSNQITVKLNQGFEDSMLKDVLEQTQEIINQRLDETGVVEPSIYRQGSDAIVIQLPGVSNPERIRQLLGSTAQLSFHWLADSRSNFSRVEVPDRSNKQDYQLEKRIALEGKHVNGAHLSFNQDQFSPSFGEPLVRFNLDKEGAQQFAQMTKNNIGRQLAIVLDGKVVSAPVINSIIPSGQGEISGAFTQEQAADLALVLRSGALPAELTEIERHTVGPQLGSDAIQTGLVTGLIGCALVFLFMIATYGRWGFIANINLLMVMILIFSGLSLLRATLTLPGIAGLILTLGMAVDANILVNERIREEIAASKKTFAAVKEGFQKAFNTILDANITTLIAVALLFSFGDGPIKGFAVTIGLGICATLFTIMLFTRPIMEWLYQRSLEKSHRQANQTGQIKTVCLSATGFNFMATRFKGLILSLALSLASIVVLTMGGLNLGVDFSGGSVIHVFNSQLSADTMCDIAGQAANIQEIGKLSGLAGSEFLLKLPLGEDNNASLINTLQTKISEASPSALFEVSSISGRVSSSFLGLSIATLLISGLGISIYLWARYQNYFALAALSTLALDLTKTLGFIAIIGLEFNLTIIAALLALVGYSINDKVVVFDRIRENMRNKQQEIQEGSLNLHDLLNKSINATLRRTVLTSTSTLAAIVPMAIAGGSVVSSFSIPLIFGIVISTSSSIFVAAPLILHFGKKKFDKEGVLLHRTIEEGREESI